MSKGGTGILFQILITASKETPSEELMLQLHSLLAKVGPKGMLVTNTRKKDWRNMRLKLFSLEKLGIMSLSSDVIMCGSPSEHSLIS